MPASSSMMNLMIGTLYLASGEKRFDAPHIRPSGNAPAPITPIDDASERGGGGRLVPGRPNRNGAAK